MPEEVRQEWFNISQSFDTYKQFLKHSEWQPYSRSSDGKTRLYSRISNRNLLCLKSISHCRGDINKMAELICNLKLKPKFDDTVEGGHFVYENLPNNVYVFY